MPIAQKEHGLIALQSTRYARSPQGHAPGQAMRAPETLTHVVGDQSAVMRFLANPASHNLSGQSGDTTVERIDTHGAAVFLAGQRAYKVKRAVCFPFMDFSTLARREEACRAEIVINKPNAPEIYLDTVAITRDKAGQLAINGQGEAIEWAVAMRRFDTTKTFDRLAQSGELTQTDLDGAVDALIAFQDRAPVRRADDWVSDLDTYIEQNDQAFHEAHKLFSLHASTGLTRLAEAEWRRMRPLLLARGDAKAVRRCHGDVHLRNLVRLPEGVRMFDAVEFDDAIATGDVLYDLAFLLMDLDHTGERESANRVLNRYLALRDEPSDFEALAALPLFLSIRAGLRAKISAMSAQHLPVLARAAMEQDALRFFSYACDVLEPRDISLTVVGGLSGTGKSTTAQALATTIGRTPGAVVLRSDIIRKTIMGVPWTERLDASAYTATVSQRVFAQLQALAQRALAAGHSVIVDAVCAQASEREAFEAIARAVECHFAGVWLDAPLDVRLERIAGRRNDASDADAEVVRDQEHYSVHDVEWPRVDASGTIDDVLGAVRPLVDRLN